VKLRTLFLALLLTGCASPPIVVPSTPTTVPADSIVVQSRGGELPTRPAPRTPEPTATTDLALLIRTVAPFPTRSPGPPDTPTPTVVPAYTSTPRPTPTFPRGSFPNPQAGVTLTVPSPRTSAPRGTFIPRTVEPKVVPTETPIDANEPNDAPAQATGLSATPLDAAINGPGDTDVYQVAVSQTNVLLVVTISGIDAPRYKVDVIGPRGSKVGRQRLDGTRIVRALADVGSETGTYYVYVQGAGPEMPRGPYVISADFTLPAVTPTETGG
jgi:hypothetical protein